MTVEARQNEHGEGLVAAGSLVEALSQTLRTAITSGAFRIGDKFPSQAELTRQHGVSRTVVREAIATLRADGLVEARQGSGVFVIRSTPTAVAGFGDLDYDRVASVIEMLEIRTALETEAAALAALRRSPAQEERIFNCLRAIRAATRVGGSAGPTDFELHVAIAEASNNPRFAEYLKSLGTRLVPLMRLDHPESVDVIDAEHAAIVAAISNGDSEQARAAMRAHLKGTQSRYRAVLHGH
jgi:DNA-binding FadR family transcriptional regulator